MYAISAVILGYVNVVSSFKDMRGILAPAGHVACVTTYRGLQIVAWLQAILSRVSVPCLHQDPALAAALCTLLCAVLQHAPGAFPPCVEDTWARLLLPLLQEASP